MYDKDCNNSHKFSWPNFSFTLLGYVHLPMIKWFLVHTEKQVLQKKSDHQVLWFPPMIVIDWKAKGFNYQSFAYTVRSFCLSADVTFHCLVSIGSYLKLNAQTGILSVSSGMLHDVDLQVHVWRHHSVAQPCFKEIKMDLRNWVSVYEIIGVFSKDIIRL